MANESKIWIPISQPPLSKIINQSHYSSLILPVEALGVKLRPSYCKAGTNRTTSEALPSIISIQARVKEGSNQLPPPTPSPQHTHALGQAQGAALRPTSMIWPMTLPAPTSS